jgi:choline-sulfatase
VGRAPLSLLLAVLAATGLAGSSGCGRSQTRPDAVVLIVIDTVRPDHLGCYGSATARTPHLDAFAASGTVFTDAMTPVPVTLPAVSSLLTGRWPFDHGVRDNQGFVLGDDEVTLAERFQARGWHTGAVLGSAVLDADRGLDQGFATYDDDFEGPYPVYAPRQQSLADEMATTRRRADVVTDRALAAIDRFGGERFFLLVHYFDAHDPYDPPPSFRGPPPEPPYDGEIAFVDSEVGRLLTKLKARPNALVVIVSDHGEGLGEHGESTHGFLLYQSTLHVVCMVRGPGVPAGLRREDPVSLVDLAPTLAEVADLPAWSTPRDGRVLRWGEPERQFTPLYAETFRTLVSYDWSELRALREGRLKLIEGGGRRELYDLTADPYEVTDLSVSAQPSAEKLARKLAEETASDDPEQVLAQARGMVDEKRKRVLASLGYVGDTSSDRGSAPRPHPRDALPRWMDRQVAKAWLREGMSLVEGGRFAEAIPQLERVLERDPSNAKALYYRGLAREQLGDHAGSEKDLRAAEQADPDLTALQLELAVREEEAGHPERGWRRLEDLLLRQPDDPRVLDVLAESYVGNQQWDRARPHLRALVRLQPDDAWARYWLAEAARQLGDIDEARREFTELLRRHPEHPQAARISEFLAKTGPGSPPANGP